MHQGIDLSRFKKVSSDGKTSTLRHAKGHEIKIAHNGLSAKMNEHLKNMPVHLAEGGAPAPTPAPTPLPPEGDDEETDDQAPSQEPMPTQPEQAAPAQQSAPAPAQQPTMPQEEPAAAAPQAAPAAPQNNMAPASTPIPQPINSMDLKKESVNFDQDLSSGHIKPETLHDLFEKKSTFGKIGTIFGLLVGGAGAGLSHQPNALLEMMNKEIDRDLEAQKASASNRQNLYKLNLEHQLNSAQISRLQKEGVLTDAQAKAATSDAQIKAYSLTKMQMNSIQLHNLVQKTNKLPMGSPQRVEAEKQLAFLSQSVQNENFNLADRASAAGALSNVAYGQGTGEESDFQNRQNALRVSGNPQMADSNEQKHFPGIKGQASVPLSGEERQNILAGTQFQNEMKRFIDWTKSHSGDVSPKERAEGQAMAAQLQGAYRQATHGGVYKEGEQGFISHIIDSTPTKFFNEIRVLPKLQAVQRESASQLNDLVKSKGFQGYEGHKAESGSSDQYKTVNGVKYKRGPNGEAVKVK